MKNTMDIKRLDKAMQQANKAFETYRKYSLEKRKTFMYKIAQLLEQSGDELIATAAKETNLTTARLINERSRTVLQLRQYADACKSGEWLEARINTASIEKNIPEDLRKMMIPLGPVIVFGASNFPFAYSTAGGDTACAFAAGCSVIVKAHPAHIRTSTLVADIILRAAKECKMPEGIFTHIKGESFEVGKYLVTHPLTKAVGFTGSFSGGKQLFDWGNAREIPIPVFAEMGSTNPVFFLPGQLKSKASEIADTMAKSVVLGVGQFCTNPGIMVGIESDQLNKFKKILSQKILESPAAKMLHEGIKKSYIKNENTSLRQKGVTVLAKPEVREREGRPLIAEVDARYFLKNKTLHHEVFGPYSILVKCRNMEEMIQVASSMQGQLTGTIWGSESELKKNKPLLEIVQNFCGRIILNGVPTGVAVCLSMQHGGPFPASTDPRFTSVGADGIKRFTRPIAFQNWSNNMLPDELRNENPLKIWRTLNGELTKDNIKV
ncbi:MAG: aldehyde dehydrogenase (NADP(+)) [Bacteroidetes bacterium]|nr:aldehyde dehydrogenase (NADP(+)) [Bacteroidota bacterium]